MPAITKDDLLDTRAKKGILSPEEYEKELACIPEKECHASSRFLFPVEAHAGKRGPVGARIEEAAVAVVDADRADIAPVK